MSRLVLPTPGRLFAALAAAALVLPAAAAGPVPSTQTKEERIQELEDAGAKLQQGKVDEAYDLIQKAVKKNPQLPPARLILARFLARTQELQQQARQTYERAASENPDHPEIYLTGGSLALADGRITDTILNCQTALTLSGADRWTAEQKKKVQREARAGLAAAFEARADWGAARTHLGALLDIDKADGAVRGRLARALFFLDRADDAYNELQQAVKDTPALKPPAVTMAELWTAKGDTKKAREWMERAVKAENNSARVHLAYADWLLAQNEVPQAKIHVETAEKL